MFKLKELTEQAKYIKKIPSLEYYSAELRGHIESSNNETVEFWAGITAIEQELDKFVSAAISGDCARPDLLPPKVEKLRLKLISLKIDLLNVCNVRQPLYLDIIKAHMAESSRLHDAAIKREEEITAGQKKLGCNDIRQIRSAVVYDDQFKEFNRASSAKHSAVQSERQTKNAEAALLVMLRNDLEEYFRI